MVLMIITTTLSPPIGHDRRISTSNGHDGLPQPHRTDLC
jgi:hypothetical protein